ncbi:MAG: hypothetical protein RJA70_3215 [Pseudomonadota bacterium]|jgi:DNA-binding response OmpR family regulator
METVLIVERDKQIREVLRSSLAQQGYGAAFVDADPREIQASVRSLNPCLVLGEGQPSMRTERLMSETSVVASAVPVTSRPLSTMELLIAVKLATRRGDAAVRRQGPPD